MDIITILYKLSKDCIWNKKHLLNNIYKHVELPENIRIPFSLP